MGKIEVIGTSHIAKESSEELRKKIHDHKPDLVTVELDPIRFHELMSKKKRRSRRIRLRDIPRIGLFGWLFAVIGALAQKHLGKRAGAKPGSDMKAAILAAREVDAQVVLIDRGIGETVHRLSTAVPTKEKFGLLWFILFGWLFEREEMRKLNEMDLTKVPSSVVVRKLITDFRHRFPNIYKVLVSERDVYMATRIKLLHEKFPKANILVVVGAGHVDGIKKLLHHKKK